jgi:hypothetical protein
LLSNKFGVRINTSGVRKIQQRVRNCIKIGYTTQGDNAAIYHIEVDSSDVSYIYINLESTTWVLSSKGEYMMSLMQGLYIEFEK